MSYADETIMAYVDRELDEATAAALETAAARDAELAARIERGRRLRAALQAAYAPVLDEPIPQRLLATLQAPPRVVDVAAAPAPRAARWRLRWRWFEWGALAASLALGALIGSLVALETRAPIGTEGGQLVARGALARALTEQLAAAPPDDAPVRIGLSFVSKAGEYCRTFALASATPLAGLACRSDDRWRVQVVAAGEAAAVAPGGYRPAATELPSAVLRAVDEAIAGTALDAEAERAARDRGWRR
jgi:hypothetical protein